MEDYRMDKKFTSNFAYANIEENVITVGFADNEFETKEYILLQKNISPDKQEIELGHDKIYIEYKDQLYSNYGGIEEIVLNNKNIKIRIDDKTSNILKVTVYNIEFNINNLDTIRDYLKKMLKNDDVIFKDNTIG
jgi:hypothetical protein